MANVRNVNIDIIKARAKELGLTMKYLCDCIGKPRGFLSVVRNGRDYVDDRELAIIADKLHTTPAYLTGATSDPRIPDPPRPTETDLLILQKWRQLSADHRLAAEQFIDFMLAQQMQ